MCKYSIHYLGVIFILYLFGSCPIGQASIFLAHFFCSEMIPFQSNLESNFSGLLANGTSMVP